MLIAQQLAHIDFLEETIERLSAEIAQRMRPFGEEAIERLETIPGVGRRTAKAILAEIGPEVQDKDRIVRTSRVRDIETGAVVREHLPRLPWRKITGGGLLAVGVLLLVLAILFSWTANLRNGILSGVGLVSVVAVTLVLRTLEREGRLAVRGGVQSNTIDIRPEPTWRGSRTVSGLMKLRKHDQPEHDHLMSPSWAGWELS